MAMMHNEACPPDETPLAIEQPRTTLVDLLTRALSDPIQRITVIGGLVCLALFCILFRDNLGNFYYAWTTDDNYSHGFLVPLLSLYFASQVIQRGTVPIRSGVGVGCTLLGLALFGRLISIPLPIPFVGNLALLIGLAGIFALLLGTTALKRYWFVFFFLVFMVPLPIAMYSRIASPLQLLASRLASTVMNSTGVPVLCEGNRMTLPGGVQMFVAEACSGMRQMTGFLALTAAVAYLSPRPGWYRSIVILSALPIALTANIARIVMTGYIMHFVNPQYASGTYHTLEGIIMMGFGLLLLNCLCSLLNQIASVLTRPTDESSPDSSAVGSGHLSSSARPATKRARIGRSVIWPHRGMTESLVSLGATEELP
jgi:exosortase